MENYIFILRCYVGCIFPEINSKNTVQMTFSSVNERVDTFSNCRDVISSLALLFMPEDYSLVKDDKD